MRLTRHASESQITRTDGVADRVASSDGTGLQGLGAALEESYRVRLLLQRLCKAAHHRQEVELPCALRKIVVSVADPSLDRRRWTPGSWAYVRFTIRRRLSVSHEGQIVQGATEQTAHEAPEPPKDRLPGWKVPWQHAPAAACPRQIGEGVQDLA